jgi:anti-sigma B factor antagonist
MVQLFRRTDDRDQVMILGLVGELDLAAVPSIRAEMQTVFGDGWRSIVFDLTGVGFIDSAGLGTMIGARRRCREAGGGFALAAPSDEVRNLVERAGLETLLSMHGSVDGALMRVREELRDVAR